MSLSNGMEEYYQKVIQLQEQLRQSEDDRLKLEMKFNDMLQLMKEEEEAHFKKLRSKYKQFLDEDRRRQQRNDKILEALDRIENRTIMWEAKTEKFKSCRKRYHDYLKYAPSLRSRSPLDIERTADHKQTLSKPPPERKMPFTEEKYPKGNATNSNNDIVEKYLQSLSSQKCKEDVLQRKVSEKLSPENKYSNLGNINSYWKTNSATEKTDPEKIDGFKDNLDSTQLKTNKNLENSLKQNSKGSVPVVSKYDYSELDGKSTFLNANGDNKPPTDIYNKVLPKNVVNQPDISYSQQLSNYNSNANNLRENSGRMTEGGVENSNVTRTSIESPEQVHGELERMLKQRKSEINTANNQNSQEPRSEQLMQTPLSNGTQPLQFQPVPKQQSQIFASTGDNTSRVNQPTNQPIEPEENLKDEKILNDSRDSSNIQCDNNWPSPQPITTDLRKPSNNSLANLPEPVNTQTKNQSDFELSQADEKIKPTQLENEPKMNQGGQDGQSSRMDDKPEHIEEEVENHIPLSLQQDMSGNPPSKPTDGNELVQEQQLDSSEPLLEQKYDDQPIHSSQEYHTDGQQLQYDTNGQPTQLYNKNGQYDQQYYDENGQPLQQYDENGQQLQQYYDENGQPLPNYPESDQAPPQYYDENGQELQQYDENGQPLQNYGENGQPLQQYYDNAGQPLQQYDENGQPLPQYDENGQPLSQYDENGQTIAQYDENSQPFVQYDQTTQPQYDETGQPLTQYDENGQPIPQYDENGRIIPQYGANGQPITQYDANGRIIPQYDANGQPITQYDANGQPIQQYYDKNGQPVQYIGEGGSAPQYDENGQPLDQQYTEQLYGDGQYYDQQEVSGQQQEQSSTEAKPKVLDMLDTDTESAKQDTKISNDSDFDISNA